MSGLRRPIFTGVVIIGSIHFSNIGKVSIYELPHREEKTKSSRVGGGGVEASSSGNIKGIFFNQSPIILVLFSGLVVED